MAISNSVCFWGKIAIKTLEMLKKSYRNETMKEIAVYECHEHFHASSTRIKPGVK